MSNPFEPPSTSASRPIPPGSFDIALALQDGWDGLRRNALPWLAGYFVVILAMVVSLLACLLPALAVGPIMAWGMMKQTLEAVDGDTEISTVWSGFDRFGEVWVAMFLIGLMLFMVGLPGTLASQVLQFAFTALSPDLAFVLAGVLLGTLVSLAWAFVIGVRFWPAMYLVVDGKMPPYEAMQASWRLTGPVWGQCVLFAVAVTLVQLVGLLLCFVGLVPTSLVAMGAQASMYRQLTGTRAS